MVRNNKGFTLPELTVTSVLIGLVILLLITLMLSANKSFKAAEEQSILHKELAAEANYITDQVRNARSLEVLNELNIEDLSEGYNCIYLEGGKVKKKVSIKSSKHVPMGAEVWITNLTFQVSDNNLIKFTIAGELKKGKQTREYVIESNVVAENLREGETLKSGSGNIIKYEPKPLEEVK